MKKLFAATLFMFGATAAFASGPSSSAPPPAPVASEAVPMIDPDDLAWCQALRADCNQPCYEMVGNAKGQCLRNCTADYNACVASFP